MLRNPTVCECLNEAIRLYLLAEEQKSDKCVSYNIAKSMYEKA